MASQEFLASFAVDIDEAGVSRLQQVPEENRTNQMCDILEHLPLFVTFLQRLVCYNIMTSPLPNGQRLK